MDNVKKIVDGEPLQKPATSDDFITALFDRLSQNRFVTVVSIRCFKRLGPFVCTWTVFNSFHVAA